MQFRVGKTHLLLSLSVLWTTAANQACFASRGDIIAHTVPQTTVRTYRVAGWQNQLTAANPNLANYYWEPLTKRIINITGTTSKGATAAPLIIPDRTSHYVKPNHASLSVNNTAQLKTNAVELSHSTSLQGHCLKMPTVLTYHQNGQSWSHKGQPDLTTVATCTSRESVYGVVKAGSVRAAR